MRHHATAATMLRILVCAMLCAGLGLCAGPARPARAEQSGEQSGKIRAGKIGAGNIEAGDIEANVLRSVLPAIVNVSARRAQRGKITGDVAGADVAGAESAEPPAWRSVVVSGSGFIVRHSGVIVTNWHVIEDAYKITITFVDGSHARAHVVSAARPVDIALIKVDVDHPLPVLSFGDSDGLQIGDPVFAVGNPLGLGTSVSAGIVSALNRDVLNTPYDDFIQTDAAINHGNSGGPLLNTRGQVVGLDTALVSPTSGSSGLGFAMPSDDVAFVIERLLRYGWVRPGWIGAKLQQVTPDLARAIGLAQPSGSIVDHVQSGGPAAKAGLQVGDVILRYGNRAPSDTRALMRAIAKTDGGQQVELTVWRKGQDLQVPLTIEVWPKQEAMARELPTKPMLPKLPPIRPDLGLTLAGLTGQNRAKQGLPPGQTGVLVTGVLAGTDAARRGVVPGDVIVRVQQQAVHSPTEVLQAFAAARRRGAFVAVLIVPKKAKQPGPKWLALRVADETR